MSECTHIMHVVEWGDDAKGNYAPVLRRCSQCDFEIAEERLAPQVTVEEEQPSEHSLYHNEYTDGCFACKIRTLQLSTGDANSTKQVSNKTWDSENEFYASAVRQGINPDGLFRHEVEAALEASEVLGVPYDTDTSPLTAEQITPKTAEVMKEVVMEDKKITKGA